jgi:hypothetical protein
MLSAREIDEYGLDTSLATQLATINEAIANGNIIMATSSSRYSDMLIVNPNINSMLEKENEKRTAKRGC